MKDFITQLDHLEKQIAECDLISNLASDVAKRQTFARLANKYRAMAEAVRATIANILPPAEDVS